MTLHIDISKEAEEKLRAKAASAGKDLARYAAQVLERDASRPLTLEEISGPIAEDFRRSGMTDEELGDFLEQVKHRMRQDRRAAS
jgi:hypothetical protein